MLKPHPPDQSIELTDALAAPPPALPRGKALDEALDAQEKQLERLQAALAAEGRRALLVVLQGRDASGKDGTIRRVFGGLNPAACSVTSFKRPSATELAHDYLWRVHQAVPARGTFGVFNRSHYEDVIAVRVHRLVPEAVWQKRFDQINAFEAMLDAEGIVVRKFFLHISRDEQRRRLRERLEDPEKNWKFNEGDLRERALWDEYTAAYQEVLARCSTPGAPWYLVPANQNKPRDYLIGEALIQTLTGLAPRYPAAEPGLIRRLGEIA